MCFATQDNPGNCLFWTRQSHQSDLIVLHLPTCCCYPPLDLQPQWKAVQSWLGPVVVLQKGSWMLMQANEWAHSRFFSDTIVHPWPVSWSQIFSDIVICEQSICLINDIHIWPCQPPSTMYKNNTNNDNKYHPQNCCHPFPCSPLNLTYKHQTTFNKVGTGQYVGDISLACKLIERRGILLGTIIRLSVP